MDKVMGKHGRMYAITTLFVRGGRNWQASSIVGGTKNYWKFKKLGVEESRTLGCNLSFKDCNKKDVITNVINSQNLWQNT
jgi:hypothetical protein